MSKGQLFGDDELILEINYRSSLVCMKSNSIVYLLSKTHFYRIFKKDEDIWKNFVDIAKLKVLKSESSCKNYIEINQAYLHA